MFINYASHVVQGEKRISETQIEIRKPEGAVETVGLHKEEAGADKCFYFFFLRENVKF